MAGFRKDTWQVELVKEREISTRQRMKGREQRPPLFAQGRPGGLGAHVGGTSAWWGRGREKNRTDVEIDG